MYGRWHEGPGGPGGGGRHRRRLCGGPGRSALSGGTGQRWGLSARFPGIHRGKRGRGLRLHLLRRQRPGRPARWKALQPAVQGGLRPGRTATKREHRAGSRHPAAGGTQHQRHPGQWPGYPKRGGQRGGRVPAAGTNSGGGEFSAQICSRLCPLQGKILGKHLGRAGGRRFQEVSCRIRTWAGHPV